MTNSSFVKMIAKDNNLSQKAVKDMADMFENGILKALADDDKLTFAGLILKVVDVEERTGRNPQTGEEITVPAHKRIMVKAGSNMKKAIRDL